MNLGLNTTKMQQRRMCHLLYASNWRALIEGWIFTAYEDAPVSEGSGKNRHPIVTPAGGATNGCKKTESISIQTPTHNVQRFKFGWSKLLVNIWILLTHLIQFWGKTVKNLAYQHRLVGIVAPELDRTGKRKTLLTVKPIHRLSSQRMTSCCSSLDPLNGI